MQPCCPHGTPSMPLLVSVWFAFCSIASAAVKGASSTTEDPGFQRIRTISYLRGQGTPDGGLVDGSQPAESVRPKGPKPLSPCWLVRLQLSACYLNIFDILLFKLIMTHPALGHLCPSLSICLHYCKHSCWRGSFSLPHTHVLMQTPKMWPRRLPLISSEDTNLIYYIVVPICSVIVLCCCGWLVYKYLQFRLRAQAGEVCFHRCQRSCVMSTDLLRIQFCIRGKSLLFSEF